MNKAKLLVAIHKLNTPTFNLFDGNCGSFSIGLAGALGDADCEIVWSEGYGGCIKHCILYHKPSNLYFDGRGVLSNWKKQIYLGATVYKDIYRQPLEPKVVSYILQNTGWNIPPKRFKRALTLKPR